jgi:hypothetical protein
VPFVAEFVPEIDVETGRIVLDLPEGLLDLDLPDPTGKAGAGEADGA